MSDKLVVRGAREHNLRNVSIELPRDQLITFTGLSGSGKSSFTIDTLYASAARHLNGARVVAGDVVRTVALEPTLINVAVLGLLVALGYAQLEAGKLVMNDYGRLGAAVSVVVLSLGIVATAVSAFSPKGVMAPEVTEVPSVTLSSVTVPPMRARATDRVRLWIWPKTALSSGFCWRRTATSPASSPSTSSASPNGPGSSPPCLRT